MILIKNVEVYAPEYKGKKDVFISGGKISRLILLIDGHRHLHRGNGHLPQCVDDAARRFSAGFGGDDVQPVAEFIECVIIHRWASLKSLLIIVFIIMRKIFPSRRGAHFPVFIMAHFCTKKKLWAKRN